MRFEPCLLTLTCGVAAAAGPQTIALPAMIPDVKVPTLSCVQQYLDDSHAKSSLNVNLQKAEVNAGNEAVNTSNTLFPQVWERRINQRPQPASKGTGP